MLRPENWPKPKQTIKSSNSPLKENSLKRSNNNTPSLRKSNRLNTAKSHKSKSLNSSTLFAKTLLNKLSASIGIKHSNSISFYNTGVSSKPSKKPTRGTPSSPNSSPSPAKNKSFKNSPTSPMMNSLASFKLWRNSKSTRVSSS